MDKFNSTDSAILPVLKFCLERKTEMFNTHVQGDCQYKHKRSLDVLLTLVENVLCWFIANLKENVLKTFQKH